MSRNENHISKIEDNENLAQKEILEILNKRNEFEEAKIKLWDKQIEYDAQTTKLHHELQMKKLSNEDDDRKRHIGLTGIALFFVAIITFTLISILGYMAFWGEPEQKSTALKIIEIIFTALGGYGVLSAAGNAFKKISGGRSSAD